MPSPLIGEWETTLLVSTSEDSQLWTTRWIFNDDATCQFRQTILSVLAGETTREQRECHWTESSATAAIVFDDTGEILRVPFSFPPGERDRMIFEGFEYQRVG